VAHLHVVAIRQILVAVIVQQRAIIMEHSVAFFDIDDAENSAVTLDCPV
jgi:hypothetical protein